MGVRRWLKGGLDPGDQDPEALVDAACVPLAQGPIVVAALTEEGIEVAGWESFDVVTDVRSTMRIMVRRRDLAAAMEIIETMTDLSDLPVGDPERAGDFGHGAESDTGSDFGADLAEEDPGDDGDPELLGELFVVADRLLHAPYSEELIGELEGLRAAMAGTPPFGIEQATWTEAVERSTAVIEASRSGSDEAVESAAGSLRSLLRDLV